MATKKFLYEIGTKGAKKAQTQLKGVDNATKKLALESKQLTIESKKLTIESKKLTLSQKKAAIAAKQLALSQKKTTKSTNRLRVATSGLRKNMGILRNNLLLITFATAGTIVVIKKVVDAFIEQEKSVAKLEAALKSTNMVAGLTSNQLQAMAAELQQVTIFGDETIITAQSLLLTFTQIGRDVFPQAIEAILNVSTAMGTDLQSSVLQLGKALNDPILGIAALTRVGIQLSATQKEQIKLFVEEGKTAEAQRIILGELETQFGELARAMTDTTEGAMKQMTNAFGDMAEVIGEGLSPAVISLAIVFKRVFEDMAFDIGALFGILTPVEKLQRRLIRNQQTLSELEGGFLANTINKELIESFRLEVEELTIAIGALQSIQEELDNTVLNEANAAERLRILTEWANATDEVKEASVRMLEKVVPLWGSLGGTFQALDTTQQLLIDNVEELTDGLIQATLYGQRFGDAIVSSLKAIAAELIKQAAVFLLMNLFTGGTASLTGARGFFNFVATGNFIPPTPSINSGGGNQGPAVINQNTFLIINDEQATELQSILNRAQFNA